MSTKIGPFEILSELSKSPTGVVYKANDPESGQTIALKTIQLNAFGESAAALEQALLAEAESCKVLSSSNIANVSRASVIDGQFCAGMEYIQGNSIATMLARKEGFSIWDLLDIGRQLSSALEHAKSHALVHYSLEPAKIMCGWDGTVRILGYGISSVGKFVQHGPEGIPSISHYMSPEQVRGEACDSSSNLFSLGAMLYEMVTERKAFEGNDVESLRQCVLESTPITPLQVNPKVHPLLSDLIMKALAKDPARRYQSSRELLDDLENCKESRPAAKKTEAPKGPAAPQKPSATAQAKFVTPAAGKPATAAPVAAPTAAAPKPVQPAAARPATPVIRTEAKSTLAKPVSKLAVPKSAAAAAGVGGGEPSSFDAPGEADSAEMPSAFMSSAVVDEPEIETFEPQVGDEGPKIAVDPMMAEGGGSKSSGAVSFSEMTELPPLKEVYVAPPPPPSIVEAAQAITPKTSAQQRNRRVDEKPKIQPREVAQKAIKEIKGVPPKLMVYSIAGAVGLILIIGIAVAMYVHSLNSDDDSGAGRAAAVAQKPVQPEASQPAPKQEPVATQPVETQPAAVPEAESTEPQPAAPSRERNGKKKKSGPALVVPGGLAIDSTPEGAQVQLDGQTDPSWITPFALTGVQPGQHSITVSKAGYSTDKRTVNIAAGNRTTTAIHLAQLSAMLVVKSDPAGASIYVDGHDVGTKTPAQVSMDKGQHVVLVRMPGYIDETMNAQFVLGQTFNFSPTLRALGSIENIKTVGKFKLFGGKGGQAGQGMVSIHTQPKGAQVAINQHMLDKNSPVDVMLDPGNYVIDITLSGYAPVHKIVTADKGGKVVVDEVMQPQ